MKPHVWTVAEIYDQVHCPFRSHTECWWYGLCRDSHSGKIVLGEIFPGFGFAAMGIEDLLNPKEWWFILRDLSRMEPWRPLTS